MGALAQFLSLLLIITVRCVVKLIVHYPFQPSIKIDNYMNVFNTKYRLWYNDLRL